MEHSFNPEIATKYGLEEAILLNHIAFWTSKNKANEKHYHDGRYWTYNSTRAFSIQFPYIPQRTLTRKLQNLVDKGLLITANYNENKYDRTLWYALTDLAESIMPKCQMDIAKMSNGYCHNGEPIPYIEPYINNKENILKENSDVQGTSHSSNTNLTSSTMFDLNSESKSSKPNALTREKVCITDTGSIEETKPSHTNKVYVDSGKEKEDKILDIYNYWNSLGKPAHTNLTDAFVKAIKKALKTYSSEEIKKAMQNYKTVINDNSYYFDYTWGIDTFLKQSNGLPHFVDSGEKWLNYCKKKGIANKPKVEVKQIKEGLYTY